MITLLYIGLCDPPRSTWLVAPISIPAHYSNLSITTHPPTMLSHHFGFQDLFFFPGHPRGWAGLPCWQGEGSIVQFLIQVVKSYRYGSIWATFGSKKLTNHIIYSGLELPQSLASAQPPLQPPLSPPHHHQAQQSSSGTSIAGARPPPP